MNEKNPFKEYTWRFKVIYSREVAQEIDL